MMPRVCERARDRALIGWAGADEKASPKLADLGARHDGESRLPTAGRRTRERARTSRRRAASPRSPGPRSRAACPRPWRQRAGTLPPETPAAPDDLPRDPGIASHPPRQHEGREELGQHQHDQDRTRNADEHPHMDDYEFRGPRTDRSLDRRVHRRAGGGGAARRARDRGARLRHALVPGGPRDPRVVHERSGAARGDRADPGRVRDRQHLGPRPRRRCERRARAGGRVRRPLPARARRQPPAAGRPARPPVRASGRADVGLPGRDGRRPGGEPRHGGRGPPAGAARARGAASEDAPARRREGGGSPHLPRARRAHAPRPRAARPGQAPDRRAEGRARRRCGRRGRAPRSRGTSTRRTT